MRTAPAQVAQPLSSDCGDQAAQQEHDRVERSIDYQTEETGYTGRHAGAPDKSGVIDCGRTGSPLKSFSAPRPSAIRWVSPLYVTSKSRAGSGHPARQ